MENKSEVDSANTGTLKKPVVTIVVIGALSLATWYFFHLESMPLTSAETTVMVGGWVVIVLLAKWLRGVLRKNGKSGVRR